MNSKNKANRTKAEDEHIDRVKARVGWFEERFTESPGRLRFDCIRCGVGMWFPPSKAGKYKTCGGACTAQKHAQVWADRSRPCETCGGIFSPRPGQLANGAGRYCSQKCNVKSRAALHHPDIQAKAAAARKESFRLGLFTMPSGPDSGSWKGGSSAKLERQRPKVAKYKRDNPEKVRAWNQARRSKGAGRLPTNTVDRLFKAQSGKCAACRCSVTKKASHIDHINPLSKGGTNTFENVQLLCAPCNLNKGAKDPIKFMQSKGYLL